MRVLPDVTEDVEIPKMNRAWSTSTVYLVKVMTA